jgi:hypothetical protein
MIRFVPTTRDHLYQDIFIGEKVKEIGRDIGL